MTKNKLEKKFSESLKADTELWGMKLHNNPLSHQNTPGDYIIDFEGLNSLKLHLVECKQVTLDEEGKGRLAFKRLKQTHDLIIFDEIRQEHHSWFCIAYKEKLWANSDIYIVPAKAMKTIVELFADDLNLVSMSRVNAAEHLSSCKVNMINGLIDLSMLK